MKVNPRALRARTLVWLLATTACAAAVSTSMARPMTCGDESAAGQKDIIETAVAAGSFKTLAAALQAAGLIDTLKGDGPFTVFAPTDEAFAKLPAGTVESLLKPQNKAQLTAILTYHVVAGRVGSEQVVKMSRAATVEGQQLEFAVRDGAVKIDDATVVKADIACRNGVIHVIDRVMMPSSRDVVDTAVAAGSFKTLVTALKAAGLESALRDKGPFTVFAPTDEAFAKLPPGTVESLLKPESRQKLVGILKLHVVAGRIFAADAAKAGMAKSLSGATIKLTSRDGGLMVENAGIAQADIDASNGVIHVIDTVLLPSAGGAPRAMLTPRRIIELAIERGAPRFNRGDAEACVAIYQLAAESLLAGWNAHLDDSARRALESALDESPRKDSRAQAWALRRALDSAYHAL